MAKCGRRPVLDQQKKRDIVVIISMGCSRRTAARFVGCAPTTIVNTAKRDAAFAKSLRQAEQKSEIDNMKNIQEAAKKAQYWRAAAWILERRNPEDFAPKHPDVITIDDIRQLLAEFVLIIMEEVTVAEFRKRILKRLDALTARFRQPLPDADATDADVADADVADADVADADVADTDVADANATDANATDANATDADE